MSIFENNLNFVSGDSREHGEQCVTPTTIRVLGCRRNTLTLGIPNDVITGRSLVKWFSTFGTDWFLVKLKDFRHRSIVKDGDRRSDTLSLNRALVVGSAHLVGVLTYSVTVLLTLTKRYLGFSVIYTVK